MAGHVGSKLLILITLLSLYDGASLASIDKTPTIVTNQNSGPKYNIDDVERTLMTADPKDNLVGPSLAPSGTEAPAEPSEATDSGEAHLPIGRVFLIPIRSPWERPTVESAPDSADPFVSLLGSLMRPRPHLFGADQASRSPFLRGEPLAASSGEREETTASSLEPSERSHEDNNDDDERMESPYSIIMNLFHRAMSQPSPAISSLRPDRTEPLLPGTENESHQEVVQIDGKKYLRKTVISRHVGDNVVFTTRKFVFEPLRESAESEETNEPHETIKVAESASNNAAVTTQAPQINSKATTSEATTTTESSEAAEPMFNPFQIMLNLLHRTMNRTSSLEPANQAPTGSENESHSEVVEIDGKKYLRKTIITRHKSDNMVFMSRRVLFVPMNETETAATTEPQVNTKTTVTESAPSTVAPELRLATTNEATSLPTSVSSTAASTTSKAETTTAAPSTQTPQVTSAKTVDPTTVASTATTEASPSSSTQSVSTTPLPKTRAQPFEGTFPTEPPKNA